MDLEKKSLILSLSGGDPQGFLQHQLGFSSWREWEAQGWGVLAPAYKRELLQEERRLDNSDFQEAPDPGTPVYRWILGKAQGSHLARGESRGFAEDNPQEALRRLAGRLQELRIDQEAFLASFWLDVLLERGLKGLSSGEWQKVQLARILIGNSSRCLMIDPFDGLDRETRDQVKKLLLQLIPTLDQAYLSLERPENAWGFVLPIVLIGSAGLLFQGSLDEGMEQIHRRSVPSSVQAREPWKAWSTLERGREVLYMASVKVFYQPDKWILRDFDWSISTGEKWRLSGPNGAGKTTLVRMILGDHPQVYGQRIRLFGRERGSGESVWEIKKHFGYLSSTLLQEYRVRAPVLAVLISGLHDSIGLYQKPTAKEINLARRWLAYLGLSHLEKRSFHTLPPAEARMVLLARALVKTPPVLLLDEPTQNLDNDSRSKVNALLTKVFQIPALTLIHVTHYQDEVVPGTTHVMDLVPHPLGGFTSS